MWELYTIINGKTGEKQKISDFKEAKKAFRKAVKQAFDENPHLLEHFIARIDAYCDQYFPEKKRAKKPVPYSFDRLKHVLKNYVTNAAYNINPDKFSVTSYGDKNIGITWSDMYEYDGEVTLYTTIKKKIENKNKKKGQPLIFPDIWIPLWFGDDESGVYFSITDSPNGGKSLLPNTFSIYVNLSQEDNSEYFDEDDYDEDEDEDEDYDDDYDEDEDEDEDDEEEYTNHSYSASRSDDGRLTYFEKKEIEKAKNEYEKIARYVANGRLTSIYNEASEKRAYAEYMRVLAKYAGKK